MLVKKLNTGSPVSIENDNGKDRNAKLDSAMSGQIAGFSPCQSISLNFTFNTKYIALSTHFNVINV